MTRFRPLLPLFALPLLMIFTATAGAEDAATDPAPAAAQALQQQLAELVAAHDYQQAYRTAAARLADAEGEPVFDFYYGFSAAQLGYYDEALFVFERLVAEYPAVARYRLELARVCYELGQISCARQSFLLVRDSNPPAGIRQTIDDYLTRLERQQAMSEPEWFGLLSLSAGYDTNFNSATDADQINIPDTSLVAEIDSDSQASSSPYYQLRAQAGYFHPLSLRTAWHLEAGGSRKDNREDDLYDLDNLYAEGGIRRLFGRHQLRFRGRFSQYWLGQDRLLSETSAHLIWYQQLTTGWTLKPELNLSLQKNQFNDSLDQKRSELILTLQWSGAEISAEAALVAEKSLAREDDYSRRTAGLNGTLSYSPGRYGTLYSGILYRDYQYQDAPPPDSNPERDEQMLQLRAGYSYGLSSALSLYLQSSHIRYNSNVPLYEYDRTLTEAGINLSF